MDSYAKKHHDPRGPHHFQIFVFRLIHLSRLNWTYFTAVNYTDEQAVSVMSVLYLSPPHEMFTGSVRYIVKV